MRIKIVSVILALSASLAVAAQETDPGDAFLQIYQHFRVIEMAEAAGLPGDALREAKAVAEEIGSFILKFPKWSPAIVAYRQRRVTEKVEQLEQRVAGGGAAVQQASGKDAAREAAFLELYGRYQKAERSLVEAEKEKADVMREYQDLQRKYFNVESPEKQPRRGEIQPADIFVHLYQDSQRVEKVEAAGRLADALLLATAVAEGPKDLVKRYPDWSPQIVAFRQKLVDAEVARLEKRVRSEGNTIQLL